MRVVLDTNVVVSAFLSPRGAPALVLGRWRMEVFEVLVSVPILEEYRRALSYPRVQARHKMTSDEIDQVIEEIREFALAIDVAECPPVIQEDPADDKCLACSVVGGAEYVISGDAHLLQLQEYRGIPILPPADFLAVLRETGNTEQITGE